MHKITALSLCDAHDTLISCSFLRTLVTQPTKMPKYTVSFLVHLIFFYSTFILCSKRSTILGSYD
jgi:hypothetical protein